MALRKLIASRYTVVREDGDVVRFTRDGVEIKAQRVGDLVALLASVGPTRALAPAAALELNNQIVHGALAIERDVYVLRRVVELVMLDDITADRLVDKFTAEAKKIADGLTALLPASTSKTVAFEIWAS